MSTQKGPISILDRDKPPPIVIRGSEIPQYIILGTMITIIMIFWIWVMYKLYNNAPIPKYFLQCPRGQCATNIYNGEKRCLDDDTTSIIYDPTFEVCNSRYTCENLKTRYAVQNDGSADVSGICPPQNTCRCLQKPQCGTSVLVTFNSLGGSVAGGVAPGEANLTTILQKAHTVQGNVGIPLEIDNSFNDSCALRLDFANRLVPRTPECSAMDFNSLESVKNCIRSNPCTMGTIAFVTKEIESFRFKKVDGKPNTDYPFSCFVDRSSYSGCSGDRVPVWDYTQDRITCLP